MLYTDIWDKSSQEVVSRVGTPLSSRWQLHSYSYNARYILPDGSETLLNIVSLEKDRLYCLLEASVARNFMEGLDEESNPVVVILQLKP